VRRKFVAAEGAYKDDATFFIDRIRDMSKVEAELIGRPPDEILAARTALVRPIVDIIRAKAATLGHILPRSSLGRALAYMRKYWEGLIVFLTDADAPMHSNDIERAMRGPAVGRKNHYGSRNITTANVAAVWYGVVETCKLCCVVGHAFFT
jgi:transposase